MNTIIKITLSLVFISAVFVTNAQNLSYGIQAGSNFAVQSPIADYYNNADIHPGIHAGAFAKYAFGNKLSIQGELNYDQLGSDNSATKNHYDYLNIPVLLGYSFGKSDLTALTFDLYTGPYAGYLVKAESVTKTSETNQTIDLKENTNKFTSGVILGFGLRYPINNQKILLDFRLGLGLSPYDKNDYQPKNKYIGISLGYQF
jgi:hypothetical protein